ncbi:ATP-dependent helicase [Moraxella bovis]|uniref:UvrD-helicase domain-containing protein n=1 Tax=Moraxella bovis TaxID=476 RepID=UPI002225FF77|nr:ATP-dependent helicase [Moraxella bovis]UYZ68877.1 ATP-dependent helicase [Moraxella bovis]UYZ72834.1 ATP-dependent helicase [Moraxella bovis]UZA27093.1 ATP-dependent helicase [Moraxella bovis]UZA38374.1 ATP-dependent helicase [Moraxella bovis]WAJ73279.1 ATP-dependent helicase [Moraxella bovis]
MIPVEQWKPADGLTLEPNAMKAVLEQEKCLALTAGPGAGKTEMLAQRADFLFRTGTCRYPKRILAISFKVDASMNLKERVKRRCGHELSSRFDSYTFHAFAKRIIDRFRVVLTGQDSLKAGYTIGDQRVAGEQITFNDLVPLAIEILKSSEIARNAIRQTYSDVFLDEFQDCTNLQYELIKLAFQGTHVRLTAVGDTKQKIMAWAGALEGIFQTFAQDFSAVPLNMYRNFRSKPVLLRLQNKIIQKMDPNSVMPDEQLLGDEGKIIACEYHSSSDEATQLADFIQQWSNEEKVLLSEIAILISKQADLYGQLIMQELDKRQIPYRNEQQLQDISTEPITRLIVDYLLCLYGEKEPNAWIRLQEQIIPFTDDEEFEFSQRFYFHNFFSEQQRKVKQAIQNGNKYSDWWKSVKSFLQKLSIETIVALSPDYESKNRLKEIIQETKKHIDEFFQKEQDLVRALRCFSEDQAVRILTIHKSKGLEFHSVIMLGIEKETFWGNAEEERCTFFVGVSRAKQRLLLTYSQEREKPQGYTQRWNVNRNKHKEYWKYLENT